MMLLITVVGGASAWSGPSVTDDVGQSVMRNLRDRLYRHLQTLSLGFYVNARTGDLQSRITSDVGAVQTTVASSVASVLSNVVTSLSAVVAMLLLSPWLTALSLATVPLFVLAARLVGRRRRTLTGAAQESPSAPTTAAGTPRCMTGAFADPAGSCDARGMDLAMAREAFRPARPYLDTATMGVAPTVAIDALLDAVRRWQDGRGEPVAYDEGDVDAAAAAVLV